VRGHKVLLDSTLAGLYGVQTKVLVQAVKRNRQRFPSDFLFELNNHDIAHLRSQIVTSSWGGRRSLPFAFTEQGVAMLSSVLNSARAIRVNIEIMRAFVRLREMIKTNKELSGKLDELESKVAKHDQAIAGLITAIRELAAPIPPKPTRRIGFVIDQ
jgi:hypothetical protein